MFSSHTYASPKPIEAEQLNSRALMAEAEYNLLPLSLVFVDGILRCFKKIESTISLP